MCDRTERYDHVLHKTLRRIVHKRRFTSSQIKEFVSAPHGTSNRNFIIDLILKLKPPFRKSFSRKQLRKLSPLWIMVLGHCYNSAELLVRSGADVNELFGYYDYRHGIDERLTVLHALLAIDLQMLRRMKRSSKNERLIRLVMDYGADLQARDSKGRTVLHYAVMEGRVQVTETLLEKAADVNVADDDGERPLLTAARGSKADELLPLLMERGADVFAKDNTGQNVLHYLSRAREVKHVADLVRVLIEKGVSLDDRERLNQFQPIHRAVLAGDIGLINIYLDYGADVNARAYGHMLPLFPLLLAALCHEHPAVLKALLKRGADINLRTEVDGRTALHQACLSFQEENIKLLLSAGADILIEDDAGETPFALMSPEDVEHPSIRLMLKTLALKKARQPSIELKDERIIEGNPELRDYYRDCIEQLERAKSTRIIGSCILFELLTKCHCQIAVLMCNPEFGINFKNYDLSGFSAYAEDIVRAFERADKLYLSMLEHEDVLDEAINNILPDLILRKIVRYVFNDCCNEKRV